LGIEPLDGAGDAVIYIVFNNGIDFQKLIQISISNLSLASCVAPHLNCTGLPGPGM
jgi:hypothetical protein